MRLLQQLFITINKHNYTSKLRDGGQEDLGGFVVKAVVEIGQDVFVDAGGGEGGETSDVVHPGRFVEVALGKVVDIVPGVSICLLQVSSWLEV